MQLCYISVKLVVELQLTCCDYVAGVYACYIACKGSVLGVCGPALALQAFMLHDNAT